MEKIMSDLFLLSSLQNQWNNQFCRDTYYSLACLQIDEQIKDVKKRIRECKLNIPVYTEL